MLLNTLILVTLFSLPFYVVRFTVFGLPTTLLEIVLIATLAVWGFEKVHSRTFLQIPRMWRVPTTLFLLASIIALFTAPQLFPALGHWRAYILEPLLFTLILIDTFKTEHARSLVVYTLAASLVIPVAIALYQQITGDLIPNQFWADAATRRVTSVYGYPNALGLYAVPILILLLGQLKLVPEPVEGLPFDHPSTPLTLRLGNKLTITKISLSVLSLTTIATIIFTRSKGALIALAIGMATYLILISKRKLLATSVLIIAATISVFVFKDSFNLRGISTVQGGDSISVRLTQYRETWEMLKDNPIFGAGLRGYQTAMVPYHTQKHIEIFMYPHNIFLTVWSELGLLGLAAFIWIIIQFFITSYRSIKLNNRETDKPSPEPSRRVTNCAALAAMLALLIHGLIDVPFFKNDLAVLFWIIIALPFIPLYHRQQSKNMLQ